MNAQEGAGLLDRLEAVGARFVALARRLDRSEAPVPRSAWTVGDVVTHVTAGMDAYARYLEGDPTPLVDVSDMPGGSLRASNATVLARASERDPARLADRLSRRLADVVAHAADRDLDSRVPWHGREERLRVLLAAGLGELLVHGLDVARTVGEPWDIEPADARLVLANIVDVLPLLVDSTTAGHLTAILEVRLRGSGPAEAPIVLAFTDGALEVGAGPAPRADVRISAEPVAFLLVSYGRLRQWRPIVTGRMVAWGRRPWIALRLTRYLVDP